MAHVAEGARLRAAVSAGAKVGRVGVRAAVAFSNWYLSLF